MNDEDFKIEHAAYTAFIKKRTYELMDDYELGYHEAKLRAEKEWNGE